MNSLLFLTSEDFQIHKGAKGNIMCHSIPGFSLILFYSTQCEHCKTLIPIFKQQLPGTVGGCQFGIINVSHNKQCVLMSRQTIAPIKVVPYIILYVNNKPWIRYRGPHDAGEIARFIVEVSQSIQNKKKNPKTQKKIVKDPNGGIPAYTIGKPLYGNEEDVCYLEFNNAYGDKKPVAIREARSLPLGAGM